MTIESFITDYGYLAVVLGVLIEGELVVITAGFLASRQLLELDYVIAAAVVGSVLIYQFFFLLGRTQGVRLLQGRPRWRLRVNKVQGLLERHHMPVTLGYRALFGLRMLTPFALGMTRIRHRRFLALDILPAIVWAAVFAWIGFVLGRQVTELSAIVEQYQSWAVLGLAGTLAAVLAVAWMLRCRRPS